LENLKKREAPADKMKPHCNKRFEFNCEPNFQCYWGNFSFAVGDHGHAAKQHDQKTGLFGLELFGVAGGRSMACRHWTGKKAIRYH